MDPIALVLVFASAGMHAAWNYWAKRAKDSLSFLWGLAAVAPLVAGTVVLADYLIYVSSSGQFGHAPDFSAWKLALLGGVIQAAYFSFMGAGYNRGDLSVVYPVSRGVAPVIIAGLAWVFLHEQPSVVGSAGIIVILIGTLILAYDLLFGGTAAAATSRPASSVGFALFAAVTIALYHVVDKAGAQGSSVTSYLFLMETVIILSITPVLLVRKRAAAFRTEFRQNGRLIVGAAVLMYIAYCLVVTAMMRESVAYVAAARNISILVGIVLGATRLREGTLGVRLLAGLLVLGGIFALAVGG